MNDPRPKLDLETIKDEAAFRTSVLVHLHYIGKDVEDVKEGLKDHIEKDDQRFGSVNQKIGDNSSSIAKGVGIFAALVVMIGVIMWLVDKVQP